MKVILVEKKKKRFPLKKLRREEKLSTKKKLSYFKKGMIMWQIKESWKKILKIILTIMHFLKWDQNKHFSFPQLIESRVNNKIK